MARPKHPPKLIECEYHLCDKKAARFKKCKHCSKSFCSNHKTPKPPHMINFKHMGKRDRDFIDKWAGIHGHPCPPYVDFLEKQDKLQIQRMKKALDMLKDGKKHDENLETSKGRGNSHKKDVGTTVNKILIGLIILVFVIPAAYISLTKLDFSTLEKTECVQKERLLSYASGLIYDANNYIDAESKCQYLCELYDDLNASKVIQEYGTYTCYCAYSSCEI